MVKKIPPDENQKGTFIRDHKHDASDIISGTLDVERLPSHAHEVKYEKTIERVMQADSKLSGGAFEPGFYLLVSSPETLKYWYYNTAEDVWDYVSISPPALIWLGDTSVYIENPSSYTIAIYFMKFKIL